jgi:predicted ATPase
VFKHALIQDAAYQSLLKSTRQQYHQSIAHVLEVQFAEIVEAQPELLAHHYTEAGLIEKGVHYWYNAGQRASERSAHVEGIRHLRTGLALLQTCPETPERVQRAVDLYIALGALLTITKGYTASEVEQTYTRARQLCQHLEDPQRLFLILRGLWRYYLVRAVSRTAHALGEQVLTLAQQVHDATMLMAAHEILGTTCFFMGAVATAHTHYTQSITHYYAQQHHSSEFLYKEDLGLICLGRAAWVLWSLGYPDQAWRHSQEAVTLAQRTVHLYSRTSALSAAAMFHQFRHAMHATQEYAEAMISLARVQEFPFWLDLGVLLRGWVLAHQGQAQEGIAQMTQGCRAIRATGAEVLQSYALTLLAEVYGTTGEPAAGLTVLTEALTLTNRTGVRFYESELYRLTGELLLQQSSDNQAEAEASFYSALEIARTQQAKSWELRATTSLARLWQQQGKRAEARELLVSIYGWFTEGFDTADLQDAKALLEALA